jgi:large subunit ribosomal protein L19
MVSAEDVKNMKKKLIEFNKGLRDQKKMPEIKAGDVVKISRRIIEGSKETSQMFEGIVIAVKGGQSASPTITVRKTSHGVGVEIVVPLLSPMIKKIEVTKRAKVRRSKLYFIREKSVKSLRMKYKDLSSFVSKDEDKKEEAPKEEEVVKE